MGRFDPKYTDGQKDACAAAVLDGEQLYGRKIVPREAVRMAAAGELHNLEPFEITLPTVQKAATLLRRQRTGREIKLRRERGTVEQRLEALTAQRLRILEYEQDRIEAKAKRTDLSADDLERVKRCGLAEREIRARDVTPASHTGQGARKKTQGEDPPNGDKQGASPLVRAMVKDHKTNGDGAKDGPASVPEPASVAG